MRKLSKNLLVLAVISMAAFSMGCGGKNEDGSAAKKENQEASEMEKENQEASSEKTENEGNQTRIITDGAGRQVEIPETVESIICLNVSTLRYTCYMGAQDLVAGVEDYEQEKSLSRPYSYLNSDSFAKLPVIGTNGEYYAEEIISVSPDVIMISMYGEKDAEKLQSTTGIPVVVVPGSDSMMDEGAYETFRIMGEVYGKEERAEELTDFMNEVKGDLENRTKDVSEEEKPTVYVGGLSFKGAHGFEGTEAGYGPLAAIQAKNLADETGQQGAFDIDKEQVLEWNPDVIFVDYDGLGLINEDYAANPEYYQQLKAVQEGQVYSQISFRSFASNLETALADTYYAASILYPEEFQDVDPVQKAGEIYETLLGENIYDDLKENGYEFGPIRIGE
ncbi:MAG: iron ABC transporter substrate-binding protein [Clostridiales bacterium]|nr:iron ABC transporter substrate-binding protein [Clostridiales bacterium]